MYTYKIKMNGKNTGNKFKIGKKSKFVYFGRRKGR